MLVETLPGMSFVVMDMRVKAAKRDWVQERADNGLCLLCDNPEHKRGLCTCHYGRYRTALYKQPEGKRPQFEAKQIREGKLLKGRQGSRSVVNEFEE